MQRDIDGMKSEIAKLTPSQRNAMRTACPGNIDGLAVYKFGATQTRVEVEAHGNHYTVILGRRGAVASIDLKCVL